MGNVLQKIVTDQAEAVVIAPIWTTQPWFPILLDLVCEDSYILPKVKKLLHMPKKPTERTSADKNEAGSLSCVRRSLQNRGLSGETLDILMSSRRDSTKKQYRSFHEKWLLFCDKRQISVFEADVNNVLSFLTELYNSGLGVQWTKYCQMCIVYFSSV